MPALAKDWNLKAIKSSLPTAPNLSMNAQVHILIVGWHCYIQTRSADLLPWQVQWPIADTCMSAAMFCHKKMVNSLNTSRWHNISLLHQTWELQEILRLHQSSTIHRGCSITCLWCDLYTMHAQKSPESCQRSMMTLKTSLILWQVNRHCLVQNCVHVVLAIPMLINWHTISTYARSYWNQMAYSCIHQLCLRHLIWRH